MQSDSIRDELIEWISNLKDQGMLGSLLGIKRATQQVDWADDLSPEEKHSIERGLEDLKQGRRTSSEDFWSRHA